MRYMVDVKNHKRKHYSWDEYAARKSKEYLNGIPELEMDLHKLYNWVRIRKFKKANKLLEKIEEEFDKLTSESNIEAVLDDGPKRHREVRRIGPGDGIGAGEGDLVIAEVGHQDRPAQTRRVPPPGCSKNTDAPRHAKGPRPARWCPTG